MISTMVAMDLWTILTFAGAALALSLSPGADMMFIIASGLSGGSRAAVMAVVGITAGVMTHIIVAALGLAALILAYPGLLVVIQYCGAVYLCWLAIGNLRHAGQGVARGGRASAVDALKRGYITNILNPKVALFILALVPQFTDPMIGAIWYQILILGVVLCAIGFGVSVVIGLFAGAVSVRLARHQKWLDRLAAIVFFGIAIRLVWPL